MLPIKKILWPTDFSEASNRALDTALEFAKSFSAELWLLHAVEPVRTMPAPANFALPVHYKDCMDTASRKLEAIIQERVQGRCPVKVCVDMAAAAEKILQVADEQSIDLIVIATHGESVFHHLLFGSVAEKVIRRAPCPVLVIRAPQPDT